MVSSSVRRSVRLTNRVRGGSLSVGLLDWRKGSEFGSFTCLIRITVFCMLPKATFFESYDLDLLVRKILGMCGTSTVSTYGRSHSRRNTQARVLESFRLLC